MNQMAGHQFQVQQDETITVRITESTNINPLVNYSWNGQGGPLDKSVPYLKVFTNEDPDPSRLGVKVTFFNEPGGSFTIAVEGDRGGGSFSLSHERSGLENDFTTIFVFHEL